MLPKIFRALWACAFCLLILFFAASVHAKETESIAQDVEIRIFLIDIDTVDTVAQSFTANLAFIVRWHDPELAHEGTSSVSVPLDEIWSPTVQLINQQRLVSTLPMRAEVFPDGSVVYRQRIWGNFSQPLDLHAFPFDSQILKITVANLGFGEREMNLIPSASSGLSSKLTIPDWEIKAWNFVTTDHAFEDGNSHFKGVEFSLEVTRGQDYFKYKVILPLVLIVMMSWMVFWIDPSLAGSQISVSVTAMLTVIAYRFALAGMLPRLAFLTTLDYFIIVSNLMVFLVMLEVIYTAYLSTNGQIERARSIDRTFRWIAPLTYFYVAAEILYFRVWF